jgi:excisionase family DNA binding protein
VTAEPWVGVERHLGVAKDSVDRLIEARRLPAHRLDRPWTFKLSEIDEWVHTSRAHGPGDGTNSRTSR